MTPYARVIGHRSASSSSTTIEEGEITQLEFDYRTNRFGTNGRHGRALSNDTEAGRTSQPPNYDQSHPPPNSIFSSAPSLSRLLPPPVSSQTLIATSPTSTSSSSSKLSNFLSRRRLANSLSAPDLRSINVSSTSLPEEGKKLKNGFGLFKKKGKEVEGRKGMGRRRHSPPPPLPLLPSSLVLPHRRLQASMPRSPILPNHPSIFSPSSVPHRRSIERESAAPPYDFDSIPPLFSLPDSIPPPRPSLISAFSTTSFIIPIQPVPSIESSSNSLRIDPGPIISLRRPSVVDSAVSDPLVTQLTSNPGDFLSPSAIPVNRSSSDPLVQHHPFDPDVANYAFESVDRRGEAMEGWEGGDAFPWNAPTNNDFDRTPRPQSLGFLEDDRGTTSSNLMREELVELLSKSPERRGGVYLASTSSSSSLGFSDSSLSSTHSSRLRHHRQSLTSVQTSPRDSIRITTDPLVRTSNDSCRSAVSSIEYVASSDSHRAPSRVQPRLSPRLAYPPLPRSPGMQPLRLLKPKVGRHRATSLPSTERIKTSGVMTREEEKSEWDELARHGQLLSGEVRERHDEERGDDDLFITEEEERSTAIPTILDKTQDFEEEAEEEMAELVDLAHVELIPVSRLSLIPASPATTASSASLYNSSPRSITSASSSLRRRERRESVEEALLNARSERDDFELEWTKERLVSQRWQKEVEMLKRMNQALEAKLQLTQSS